MKSIPIPPELADFQAIVPASKQELPDRLEHYDIVCSHCCHDPESNNLEKLTDDDNFWLVALSYSDQSPILEIVKGKALKQIKIKTDTGEVRGMSIRKL